MPPSHRSLRHAFIAGVLIVLAGCATSPTPQSDEQFRQSLAQAETTLAQKGAEPALEQLETIATRNPEKGEPWSYMAKILFDEQRYGEAIVSADEALRRDPQDYVAKSVRAVGGLRVAMQSLADLRADALLAGNARPDAVALASAMRETLGEDILFPDGRKRPPRGNTNTRPRQPTEAPAARPQATEPAPAPAAPPAAPAAAPGRAPDPFGNLLR
ncbi:FOG: TPR repeat [plant metagenome]|uniref:FOG: TPR repeat n=1 Tax=plant metagenome TaxID=1297885 RepID=A0A484P7X0_9ZZZZ